MMIKKKTILSGGKQENLGKEKQFFRGKLKTALYLNPLLMHYRRKKNLVRARGFESVGSKKEVSVHAVKYYDPCLLVYSV